MSSYSGTENVGRERTELNEQRKRKGRRINEKEGKIKSEVKKKRLGRHKSKQNKKK